MTALGVIVDKYTDVRSIGAQYLSENLLFDYEDSKRRDEIVVMADGLDVVDSAAQDKATADRTGLPILKITRITTKTDRFPYPPSGLVWRRLIHHRTSISSIN